MTDNPAEGTDTGSIQQRVSDVAGQAQDRAREAGEAVRGQVGGQLDDRSTQAGEQVGQVSEAMRQAGQQLRSQGNDLPAQLAEEAASRVERLGRYLRDSDGETILRDIEDFARQQPWIVAGIGLAVGLGVARLLKASGRRDGGGRGIYAPTGPSPARTRQPLVNEPPTPYEHEAVDPSSMPATSMQPPSPATRPVYAGPGTSVPPSSAEDPLERPEGWR